MPQEPREKPRGLFTAAEYGQMRAFFGARSHLAATPTRALPARARELGVGGLDAKDESGRFGLNAFKLLGAHFAIDTLVAEGQLRAGDTVVCASEGNHGRAVARAARDAGCHACVYMAHDAAEARVAAIAGEGATVVRVQGSYDDAVRVLEADAAANGWTIVSDTSWPGYERIPRLIMLGYTRMMDESREPGTGSPSTSLRAGREPGGHRDPDVVFVQGGVGGLLCAVASWFAFHHPETRVVSVEPSQAACLQASARAGRPVAVEGPLDTTLAGLRNREVSPLAFEALLPCVDAFLGIDDRWAHDAMRALGRPMGGDPAIAAGASGSAALGGLLAVCRDPAMADVRGQLGLSESSQVLVIVSEGVTDPALWASHVRTPS